MKAREIIRMIEKDGWYFHSLKGSHAQYKHPMKQDESRFQYTAVRICQSPMFKVSSNKRVEMTKRYLVVYAKCKGSNFSGHAPDVPVVSPSVTHSMK